MEAENSCEVFLKIRGEAKWACIADSPVPGTIRVDSIEYVGHSSWMPPGLTDLLYSRTTAECVGVTYPVPAEWEQHVIRQLREFDERVFRFHHRDEPAEKSAYYSEWRCSSVAFFWQKERQADIDCRVWQQFTIWWESADDRRSKDQYRLPSVISVPLSRSELDSEGIVLPKKVELSKLDIRY